MASFRSARQRQERINAAHQSMEGSIHSPPLSGIWRQRRRPSVFSTPPTTTRRTMLPPPPPSLPLRPTPHHQHRYPPNMSDSFSSFNGQSHPAMPMMAGEDAVPMSRVTPGPVWPSANQLKVAHTYGIRREDGTYTRLIRADELNTYDFDRVPVSQGPEGMIILPALKQPRPEQREGSEPMVSHEIIQSLPAIGAGRSQQVDETQMQIDSIVAKANLSPAMPPKPMRRDKIYCDKWIHEGVCAFTQLGCKYKHEMPLDKATQLSLGLNHGLPTWYKRAQTVQIRPEPQVPESPSPGRSATGPWRRMIPAGPPATGQSIRGGGMQPCQAGTPFYGHPTYGPIAPPMHIPGQHVPQYANNPFSSLSSDAKPDDHEEDKDFVWQGRGH